MDLKKINEALLDLSEWSLKRKYKQVQQNESDNFSSEKDQGDTGERTSVYDMSDGLFLKVVETSDSYGDTIGITSVQFVKPRTQQVTVYETVYE
jgi:hypothetical protein